MNEELKKMLDSINAKKQEVKDLCKAGKIEDAATAKEELKKLQAQFDLVYDLDVTKQKEWEKRRQQAQLRQSRTRRRISQAHL